MRMFDRDMKAEQEEALPYVAPVPVPAIVEQAIDTVARRLVMRRADAFESQIDWEDFADVGEFDWERVQNRAAELTKELDRGQGPFEAAYELLKRRAERET
jgi:hypothetical protein